MELDAVISQEQWPIVILQAFTGSRRERFYIDELNSFQVAVLSNLHSSSPSIRRIKPPLSMYDHEKGESADSWRMLCAAIQRSAQYASIGHARAQIQQEKVCSSDPILGNGQTKCLSRFTKGTAARKRRTTSLLSGLIAGCERRCTTCCLL